jgi:DNA-binding transcriptional MerR regulator
MKPQAKESAAVIRMPDVARKELDQVERMDAEFSMENLVDWVNSAVSRFYPQANEGGDKRVSDSFTVRTLRYYQTLGCLDKPDKDGRRAIYGFRHYLQALIIRKLLYLRYAPESIHAALEGKSNRQYKEMLFADLSIVTGHGSRALANASGRDAKGGSAPVPPATHEIWTHIHLGPGMELHLKGRSGGLSESCKVKILKLIHQEITNA